MVPKQPGASKAPKVRPGESPVARPPRSGNAALGFGRSSQTQSGRREGDAAVKVPRRSSGRCRRGERCICGKVRHSPVRPESESAEAGARGLFLGGITFPAPVVRICDPIVTRGDARRGSLCPGLMGFRAFGALEIHGIGPPALRVVILFALGLTWDISRPRFRSPQDFQCPPSVSCTVIPVRIPKGKKPIRISNPPSTILSCL